MLYKCANAYYFAYLNEIGGIESHLYYVAKKYGKYDINVFYRYGDSKQIERLNRYVKTIQLNRTDEIECEKLFVCFTKDVLEQAKANKTYLVLHGDYKDMVERNQLQKHDLPIDERIDEYLGVSQLVCDSWYEITGIKAINIYEPVVVDESEKPLLLLSATRLAKEKGWSRMVKLAKELDKNNIKYLWTIFTDSPQEPVSKNMVFVKPRLDITEFMKVYDAYIQLSDNEGFCLSIVEALTQNIPVICTDLPVIKELGLNNKNSIVLDFDMKDIPIERIKNIRKLRFNYKAPDDKWDLVLSHKKSKHKKKGAKKMKIKALRDYFDTYEKKDVSVEDVYETTEERANFIVTNQYAEFIKEEKAEELQMKANEVNEEEVAEPVVEEVKEEPIKEEKPIKKNEKKAKKPKK